MTFFLPSLVYNAAILARNCKKFKQHSPLRASYPGEGICVTATYSMNLGQTVSECLLTVFLCFIIRNIFSKMNFFLIFFCTYYSGVIENKIVRTNLVFFLSICCLTLANSQRLNLNGLIVLSFVKEFDKFF